MQNYLIDTGDEVILVDTGLPAGTPEEVPDENSPIFTGKDICSYTALHRNMVSSITQVISERIDQTRPVLFLIGQGKHLWTQQEIDHLVDVLI